MDTHGPYKERRLSRFLSREERLWHKAGTKMEKVTPGERAYLQRIYSRQVRSLDTEFGKLWRALEQQGLFERSLVLFSADHGEEFFEHRGYAHFLKLYDELLHVPLIARLPGGKPSIQRGLTALIQIAPTVLEFAGLAPQNGFDGSSFLPCLAGQPYLTNRYVIAEADTRDENMCIRTPEWKLIWKRECAEQELYHLTEDPQERKNLASERPEVVCELERLLLTHRTDDSHAMATMAPGTPTGVTEKEEKIVADRLRDLGYL